MAASGTRERIITAAEDVVLSEGVGRLTLEKAAARAGVSKGGVLYHFPSRSALVSAMVARLADSFDAALSAHLDRVGRTRGSYARAYVEESFSEPADPGSAQDAERGDRIGAAVLAAMASEPDLLIPLREDFARWQAEIEQDADDPVPGTIARLAADGLWLSELFGLGPLDPALRGRVRDALLSMVDRP